MYLVARSRADLLPGCSVPGCPAPRLAYHRAGLSPGCPAAKRHGAAWGRETTRPFGMSCSYLFSVAGVRVAVGVQPRQPRREPVDRRLELRVEIDEIAQPLGEPGHADLLITP